MCFSAGTSFAASAVLAVATVSAVAKAKTGPQRLFATIPFLFSLQQFSEGMLWLSLKDSGTASEKSSFMYVFLVFAVMVWPTFIPLCIRVLEKNAYRKKMLNIVLSMGILLSIAVGCILLLYPVQVVATYHHLHYIVGFPADIKKLMWLFGLLYIVATIVPTFISGIKKMKWLGTSFFISYLLAVIFYIHFLVSVWCFFAAVSSIIIIVIVSDLRKALLKKE